VDACDLEDVLRAIAGSQNIDKRAINEYLLMCTNLKSLTLQADTQVDDTTMAALPKGLKYLNIEFCDGITDQGKEKSCAFADSLHAAGYLYIPDSIETLLLGGKVTDLALSYLSNKKFLRKISMSFLNRITDAGIKHLPPSVIDLDLVYLCKQMSITKRICLELLQTAHR
jgi:hypothetical protein